MFKIFRPIKTILLVVVFMILAVVASVNFSNDENSKIKLKENYFWQEGRNAITFLLFGTENFSKIDFDTKFSFVKNSEKFNQVSFNEARAEFQEKLEIMKLENKFSNFLSFFQGKFAKLDKELPKLEGEEQKRIEDK